MSSPAIVVEKIAKKFRIGTTGGPSYHRMTELLTDLPKYAWQSATQSFRNAAHAISSRSAEESGSGRELLEEGTTLSSSEFWALKDISFEVQPGEVVGIIGRNGAGKSTLLKILSRITEPTSGRFGVRGRVASLLEVGTGFHPELTGRENIYVSGITLGMTRTEIKNRFDEIVDFSGVERFLDTPVKRYSSGMQVRLGFAVAAHLESETLIVDEVLAVGDAGFQRKCIGKMQEQSSVSGKTILFVSHNMASLRNLCSRGVLLDHGKLSYVGAIEESVGIYLKQNIECANNAIKAWPDGISLEGVDEFAFTEVRMLNHRLEQASTFDPANSILVEIAYEIIRPIPFCRIGIQLVTSDGIVLFTSYDADHAQFSDARIPGSYRETCQIPAYLLKPGSYSVTIAAGHTGVKLFAHEVCCIQFSVASIGSAGEATTQERDGLIRPLLAWIRSRASTNN